MRTFSYLKVTQITIADTECWLKMELNIINISECLHIVLTHYSIMCAYLKKIIEKHTKATASSFRKLCNKLYFVIITIDIWC